MRICYLAHAQSPHTQKWCQYFLKKGFEVHLISFVPCKIDGVILHCLVKDKEKQKNPNNKLAYLIKSFKVKKIIKKIQPDLIHAHRIAGYALMSIISGFKPFLLSVWGADIYYTPYKSILHKMFVKYCLKKADFLFSTSLTMKNQILEFIQKDVYHTPFGVDLNKFKPLKKNITSEKLIIGSIKKFYPRYGIEYLIKAFKIVKERNEHLDINLHLAGKGPQEEYLKNLVIKFSLENEVRFLGYLDEEIVIKCFNEFDIAVFPSIYNCESFGVAAVEAQACGLPVIVSNVGGLPESTKPNYSSILVEPKNENKLADAIEKLIFDKKMRHQMGINARNYIIENYNIEKNFKKVEDIYKEIVSAHRTPKLEN